MKKLMIGVIIVMALLVLVIKFWDKPIKKELVQDENETENTIRQEEKEDPSHDTIPHWAMKLNDIPMPDYMKEGTHIDVYFKYNQTVNGYEVTARWMPYDQRSETGMVIMNFQNKDTGDEFQYFGEKYNSFNTDDVTFAKDFKGYKNGDVYYFNYKSPDSDDPFKEVNGNSPLGYYTSFQFLDIDFDGKEELLISDMYKGHAGNNYDVYKVTNKGLQILKYVPFDRLTNIDRIDLKRKTITIVEDDGASDNIEFYFSFKKRNVRIMDIPKFYSASADRFDFDKYNKELGTCYVLDSIKEYTKTDEERFVTYKVCGSRIVKEDGNNNWSWNNEGRFKYPSTYNRSESFVEDVPANVEVYSNGKIQLCYWPLLGMWSTHIDYPREGEWLSPTERVKNVTYRAEAKLIASGYTQNGNIFYLKQKITSGGEVNHSKVLVLIYPQSEKEKVSALLNIVKDW